MRKPLTAFIFGTFTLVSASASALDGYICKSVDEDVIVKVVLSPKSPGQSESTRRAQVMVVSAPLLSKGRQTVARFQAIEGMLSSAGSVFVGYVDPRHPDTRQKGKRIGGTTLGQLKQLVLDIDFSPEYRAARGAIPLSALVIYTKRTGEDLIQEFDCVYKQQ